MNKGFPVTGFSLSAQEFDLFRDLIHRATGISLSAHKRELVVSRLAKRLRALNLTSFKEYYDLLVNDPRGQAEMGQLVNRVTTNKTDFYREPHHFRYLSEVVLPTLVEEKSKSGERRIRAWSAACSTGEEPYTIAITMAEFFAGRSGWDVKLLATDLDTEVLTFADRGRYDRERVAPVPKEYLRKYFKEIPKSKQAGFEVSETLRKMIVFRRLNLHRKVFPFKSKLDFIFCRNVMIYFDVKGKIALLRKFHDILRPRGVMFVGHSESLMMVKDLFEYRKSTIYRKR